MMYINRNMQKAYEYNIQVKKTTGRNEKYHAEQQWE